MKCLSLPHPSLFLHLSLSLSPSYENQFHYLVIILQSKNKCNNCFRMAMVMHFNVYAGYLKDEELIPMGIDCFYIIRFDLTLLGSEISLLL